MNKRGVAGEALAARFLEGRGLKIVAPDKVAAADFRAAAAKLAATQRGSMIPEDVYDLAVRERDAYRKSAAK